MLGTVVAMSGDVVDTLKTVEMMGGKDLGPS